MRETIKTHDAELYIGWPTTPDDLERDQSVQVGVRYGVDSRWAVLTSPEQVADLRRQLQRASRAVWPDSARIGPPPEPASGDIRADLATAVTIVQHHDASSTPGAELHAKMLAAAIDRMKDQPS